jgi:putative DNA primase/helicase
MPVVEDFEPALAARKPTIVPSGGKINDAISRGGAADLPDDGRPTVKITADLNADLDNCERELIASNRVEVFQRAGAIVRLGTAKGIDHEGNTVIFDQIVTHDPLSLRSELSKAMVFNRFDKKEGKWIRCYPQRDWAGLLLNRKEKNYRILKGLVLVPTMRRDGTIIEHDGYDKKTGLYLNLKGVDFGKVPENPTREDALEALNVLLEPIAKFPFVGSVGYDTIGGTASDSPSRSVQLARMMSGCCRAAMEACPLTAYTAPSMRTGKSKNVDIACVMSHGHRAPVTPASSTFEELDKQVQAMVSSGKTIFALDNQDPERPLSSCTLSSVLTQSLIEVRQFGQNKDLTLYPVLAVVSVTGNNLEIAKDLTERTILCELDAKVETPGARKFDFDPVEYALKNRARLVRAALTILRAYVVAGRPDQKLVPMGGFEDWSLLVRSPLVWLGCKDPCETMEKVRSNDQTKGQLATILDLWHGRFRGNEVTPGEAVKAAKAQAEAGDGDLLDALWSTTSKETKCLPIALGTWLNTRENVIIGGKRFVRGGRKGHPTYRVEKM